MCSFCLQFLFKRSRSNCNCYGNQNKYNADGKKTGRIVFLIMKYPYVQACPCNQDA